MVERKRDAKGRLSQLLTDFFGHIPVNIMARARDAKGRFISTGGGKKSRKGAKKGEIGSPPRDAKGKFVKYK